MRKLIALFTILMTLSFLQLQAYNAPGSYSFSIWKKPYSFSTYFEIESFDGPAGTIIEESVSLRTNYDLYDANGIYEGTGTKRVLSLGLFFTWAAEFDIYNENGFWIGMIDGQAVTSAAGRFSIYNQDGECAGVAFIDYGAAGFTIVDPVDEIRVIASLKRNYIAGAIDPWDVKVFDGYAIDPRIIKTLAAFAVDNQNDFHADE